MEIEMGPCAEFSIYHLMDLKPGEERLPLSGESALSNDIHRFFRSEVKTFGNGRPLSSDEDFTRKVTKQEGDDGPIPARERLKSPKATSSTEAPKSLSDLCQVMRSKNAGPFEITIDAIFNSEDVYWSMKDSPLLSRASVAKALEIAEEDVIWMGFYDPAIAFKVTIPRVRGGKRKSAGGFMEDDVHGSQEHMGLATLTLS